MSESNNQVDPNLNAEPKVKRRALICSLKYINQFSILEPDDDDEQDAPEKTEPWDMHLGGNHEIAFELRNLLINTYNYASEDIELQLDPCADYVPLEGILIPTRENMIAGMKRLVDNAQKGDRFVFFFAGHGYQRKAILDKLEEDHMDEIILPFDFYETREPIVDDDINKILVKPLPAGSFLTGIFDCCHSGTSMDLTHHYRLELNKFHRWGIVEVVPEIGSKGFRIIRRMGLDRLLQLTRAQRDDHNQTTSNASGSGTNPFQRVALQAIEQHQADQKRPLIIHLGACGDNEENFENERGEAMGKALIHILTEKPRIKLLDLLYELSDRMGLLGEQYKQQLVQAA